MASSNRSQVAVESSVLMRRSVWCGVVFALAVILTFLNFLPPVNIQYHVRSKVVVSEMRLEQLRDLAIADREAIKRGEQKRIQLMSVKVLDLAKQEQSVGTESTDQKVILIEVGTLWSKRCTPERHFTWLKNISKVSPNKLATAKSAQDARFARWELEAAKHYHSQFTYQNGKEAILEDASVAEIAGEQENSLDRTAQPAAAEGQRRSFQLAVYSGSADSSSSSSSQPLDSGSATSEPSPSDAMTPADYELQLTQQIEQASQRIKQSEIDWEEEIDRSSGTLQIASVPVVAPRSTSIPFWMAVSILVTGLATGSTAGWFQHRSHSMGSFSAAVVAEQLALDSVPVAARLTLDHSTFRTAVSSNGPTKIARTGRGITRMAEYALTFWVIVAVIRFLLDSGWRDVMVNSPLAALGRMLAGLP